LNYTRILFIATLIIIQNQRHNVKPFLKKL